MNGTKNKRAFTLIELLVVIAIIALLIGILLPALAKAKLTAKNVLSQANMKQLNVGSANYAADNRDLIPTYSWRTGINITFCDGKSRGPANSDIDAASWQNQEILMRTTGRCSTDSKFHNFTQRLPHRRFTHLVLLDYLTDRQPEQIAASPFDRNLIEWQSDPTNIGNGSGVPYSSGNPEQGYDDDAFWSNLAMRERWPFASTYQTVPAAWNTDGIGNQNTYVPVSDTPNLFQGGNVPLGRRKYLQVAYPSMKVYMFEEFDRFSDRQGLYFAYPEAKANLQFFDGSVRSESTADANAGWNPAQPDENWKQRYYPLDTFPLPKEGLGNGAELCQRYRWTRNGLQGIDFGGKEVGLTGLNLPEVPECFTP
jgi:prepilin-type N-terminal cleavage/methylation domain-containing protein